MFASHEVVLSMSFAQSRARLAALGRGGWLSGPSERAYAEGLDGLTGTGASGAVLSASRLVRVQLLELVPREDSLVLPLRWEATGAAGQLFPVLDADLTLSPGGEERSTLTLTGAYRPPLGRADAALDRVLLGRAAAATVRSLLIQVAASLAAGQGPPGPAAAREQDGASPGRWPAEPEASA
jgi:hypothetical protein